MTREQLMRLADKTIAGLSSDQGTAINQVFDALEAVQRDTRAEQAALLAEVRSALIYINMIMRESHGIAGYHLNGELLTWDAFDPQGKIPALLDRLPAPEQASGASEGERGTPQDHQDYLDALVAAFGEDMGDGCECTLVDEIERLKRLAGQGVALRTVCGKDVWNLDADETFEYLKQRLSAQAVAEHASGSMQQPGSTQGGAECSGDRA